MDSVLLSSTNKDVESKDTTKETKEIKQPLYKRDIAIVTAGSVDSGKSSLVGVLSTGKLDDGNGLARETVAKHQHEIKTGKTSDISTRNIQCKNGNLITLVDLCGHEKYLKTTTFGINVYFPDYAFVTVAANRGILPMTIEHLRILVFTGKPITIIITRSDLAPESIYNTTIKQIKEICKRWNKMPIILNSYKDANLPEKDFIKKKEQDMDKIVDLTNKIQSTCDYIPVITVSNKTGYYIDVLTNYISNLKSRTLWDISNLNGTIFYIDSVFAPPGIGLVLSGIVKGKSIKIGDTLLLGPNGKDFIPIRIRSMHNNNRQIITELHDQQRGCIAISSIGKIELIRKNIQKGMIVVSTKELTYNICHRFKAEIEILHHSATIKKNYSSVIHIGPVRQTARLVDIEQIIYRKDISKNTKKVEIVETPIMSITLDTNKDVINEKDSLRTGDKAIVIFKFKFKPEFIEKGLTFFFREGTTRGTGKIVDIISLDKDDDAQPDPIKNKAIRFKRKNKLNVNKQALNGLKTTRVSTT
jgi:elongation factor 1-alpha